MANTTAVAEREREGGVARSENPVQPGFFLVNTAPITLLDLDAAGLDPTQPAPAEFVQFLYDNSRSGYLTLWSAHLSSPDGGAMINKWIQNSLEVYHARALQTQMAPAGDKPAGANVTEVSYGGSTTPAAPVNVDVPLVMGTAAVDGTLTCTMGNWLNEPVSYAYAWSGAGVATESSYVVAAGDAGTSVSCIVTATNAGGATAAPPSNAVAIAGAMADTAARAAPAEAKKEEEPVRHTGASRRDYGKKEE